MHGSRHSCICVELSPYATDEVGNFSQMIEFAFSDNVEGRFRYSYNDAAGNVVDGTQSPADGPGITIRTSGVQI